MAGPHHDVAAARSAVREALADRSPGSPVLVACSGGADSLALAATVAFVSARADLRAGSVTVDHQLRPDSDREAQHAAAQCRELALDPARVVPVDVGRGGGPEGAARQARYTALAEAARAQAVTHAALEGAGAGRAGHLPLVLLGHTLDDQAETVLLGLARGSGARSLAGMPEEFLGHAPDGSPVLFRRPFLRLRRSQSEQVCHELGLRFVVDPSNAATGPWRAADGSALRRAAVRDRVLPALVEALGPGVVPALARTAQQLRRDEDHLHRSAEQLLVAARHPAGGTVMDLDIGVLTAAHPAVRTRALHLAARNAGSPPGDLKSSHIEALDALVVDFHGQGPAALPGDLRAVRRCGRLVLSRRG